MKNQVKNQMKNQAKNRMKNQVNIQMKIQVINHLIFFLGRVLLVKQIIDNFDIPYTSH